MGTKDGAHVWAHPRPNKGWRATTAEHSVPLVGRDKAVEGGRRGNLAGKTYLTLALFPDGKAQFYQGRSQGLRACTPGRVNLSRRT